MERGYVQVYTGDGKGKTTAALGLGLRAVGRGLKVMVFQFLKGAFSGELETVKRLAPDMQIRRLAETEKFIWLLTEEEKRELRERTGREFRDLKSFVRSGDADVVILDEVMAAVHHGFVSVEEVCRLIETKPEKLELVLTGRNAPAEILERADLVTEMNPLKHYYTGGVTAREGIEK